MRVSVYVGPYLALKKAVPFDALEGEEMSPFMDHKPIWIPNRGEHERQFTFDKDDAESHPETVVGDSTPQQEKRWLEHHFEHAIHILKELAGGGEVRWGVLVEYS